MASDHLNYQMRNQLMVALDVDSAEKCLQLAETLKDRIGAFKVGPRLVVRYGADLIQRLATHAPVFLDQKYLDIPSTMEGAVRASFESGATFTTIHAWSGGEAMTRLAQVEKELNQIRPFKILTVTILTSFTQKTLVPALAGQPISQQVEDLAALARAAGLSGLVCSPQELVALRRQFADAFLVSPGVRLATDSLGDQRRVETPQAAIAAGASAIVVGRPIIEAEDPAQAAERILESMQRGLA